MALNDFQKQEAAKLFAEGRSTMDVYKHLGAKSAGFKSPIDFIPPPSSLTAQTPGQRRRQEIGKVVTDIPQDIFTGGKQLIEGYQQRGTNFMNTAKAAIAGEQSMAETAYQTATNLGGALIVDPAYQLLRTGASFATTPEQETKIAEGVGQAVQGVDRKTGISEWFNKQDERTQRNIKATLDLVDILPVSLVGKLKSVFKGRKVVDATPKIEDAIIRAEQGDTSDALRIANTTLDETTRAAEVEKLGKAYQDSLVGDRVKVNRLLQEQAQDMSRGDVVVTQDDLVKALAEEGIIPDIRGKLADFTTEIRNLDKRQNELFKAYQPVLEASKATASIDDFASYAKRSIADSRNLGFELTKAEAQLDTVIENLRRKYGDNLSAKQIDEISREANARSKAYREGGNTFEADIYSELGRGARTWLNDNIPDNAFREVNDEWLRLEQVKRTAETMQNQQIDVGLLGRALGSYVTTLTGVTLASGVSNPFMGVAAGILTKMGGDAIADMMRSTRFSPEIRAKLQERLTTDKALIEKLKQTSTTEEAKNLYDQLSRLLPAPKEGALRSEVSSGAPVIAGGKTPDGVVQPGVTERAVEGGVRQPEVGNPTPLPRGMYPSLSDAEISQLNTETFRKTLENAGVDAEIVKKALIGGAGAYLLMAYLGEDGTMAPAGFAILSALPKSLQQTLIKETKEIAKKTGKTVNEASFKTGVTPEPTMKTKREVTGKTVSGEKFTVPAGAVVESSIDGAKVNITVDGKSYVIPKNQYQNLVGQSDVAKASPFAPELEGTVETVNGATTKSIITSKQARARLEEKGIFIEKDMSGDAIIVDKNGDLIEYDDLAPNQRKLVDSVTGGAETYDEIGGTPTKYSQYTLPGGENYREILIQAPLDLKKGEYGDVIDTAKRYQSSHWSEPNVISHLRMNERTVGGKKYAFMEELQSDWAREGREKGFDQGMSLEEGRKLLPKGWRTIPGDTWKVVDENGKTVASKLDNADKAFGGSEAVAIGRAIGEPSLMGNYKPGVPNNPLLKNWQIPTVKRALMEAVDSGADRFAWINGEQTSARYNLATHVEEVNWQKNQTSDGGRVISLKPKETKENISIITDGKGNITSSKQADWKGKKLDEVLGKGLADKIMEKPDGTLSGDGLSFGGEWAHNLYDKQVRDIVKKLTGAEVKEVDMGLPVKKGKFDEFTLAEGNDAGGFVTPSNLKKSVKVTDRNGTEFVVTDVLEGGEFRGLPVKSLDDYKVVKAQFSDKYKIQSDTITFDTFAEAKKYAEDAKSRSARYFKIDSGNDNKTTQQYIDLTPEVKAKIQSKAPSFKMKIPSAGQSIPLLLLMLGGGAYAESQ